MEATRIRIMFEKEMEMKAKTVSQIGPNLWMVEAEDGNTYKVTGYGDQPLSED